MENDEQKQQQQQRGKEKRNEKKTLIQIPSYQEVFNSGTSSSSSSAGPQPYNPPAPPSSFSRAFSFIQTSEFYTPPPPTPTSAADSQTAPPGSSPASASTSTSSPQNRNAILVSHRQSGNPLLKHIRNVRWVFADIVPDYLLGLDSCALYIRRSSSRSPS